MSQWGVYQTETNAGEKEVHIIPTVEIGGEQMASWAHQSSQKCQCFAQRRLNQHGIEVWVHDEQNDGTETDS